jgi:hypothetical protein
MVDDNNKSPNEKRPGENPDGKYRFNPGTFHLRRCRHRGDAVEFACPHLILSSEFCCPTEEPFPIDETAYMTIAPGAGGLCPQHGRPDRNQKNPKFVRLVQEQWDGVWLAQCQA